jgi:hypothetical protein
MIQDPVFEQDVDAEVQRRKALGRVYAYLLQLAR